MAQEIDLIFESLREIKRANSANSESFERLLVSVANKLEILDKNSASAELIKSYLSDLAKMSDDKYKTTLDKFSDIEKALKAIFNEQDEHVKTKEMKELILLLHYSHCPLSPTPLNFFVPPKLKE